MDVAILRMVVAIQIEQGDLLKRLARSAAIHEVRSHNYFLHAGSDSRLRDESRGEVGRVEEHIERNQERLRGLAIELSKVPVSATS